MNISTQTFPQVLGLKTFARSDLPRGNSRIVCDMIHKAGGKVVVYLAEVTGRDLAAPVVANWLIAEMRHSVLNAGSFGSAISTINQRYCNLPHPHVDRFVTLIAAEIDAKSNRGAIVCAGHIPGLLCQRTSHQVDIHHAVGSIAGPPIGLLTNVEYQTLHFPFVEGDCLVVFSDTITGALDVDQNLLGINRVVSALRGGPINAVELGKRVISTLADHCLGRECSGGWGILCVERTAFES